MIERVEMPHTDIDLLTHLLLALYPAAVFFFIEVVCRLTGIPAWRKHILQGLAAVAFAVAYITVIDASGIAVALFIFAPLLFLHARNVKVRDIAKNQG